MTSIVVGIDGSAGSAEALRWTVDEARLHDARVIALRCWGGRDHLSREGWDEELRRGRAACRSPSCRRSSMAPSPSDADLVEQPHDGRPPGVGPPRGRGRCRPVVVGARGATGVKGLVVGSVSQQVVHHAHVPVAVVRHTRWPVAPRRVVVGVDGSPASRRALGWAVEEARRRGAVLEAVHAWSEHGRAAVSTPTASSRPGSSWRSPSRRSTRAPSSNRSRQTVVAGSPGPAIVDVAAGAELVVVGSRGLGGFKELLLGSVGQHVAHHAPCPVIVVRPAADETD